MTSAQNKGRSYMAKASQYFYTATSPILRTANLPTPQVTYPTFQTAFGECLKAKQGAKSRKGSSLPSVSSSLFRPGLHPLPEGIGKESDLLKKRRDWKAAGFRSNRVATAATMFLVADQRNEWKNVQNAWACFLAAGN